MKTTFLVTAKAYRDFIVEADTRDEAIDIANEEYNGGFDWEVEEYTVECELKTEHEKLVAERNGAEDIYLA